MRQLVHIDGAVFSSPLVTIIHLFQTQTKTNSARFDKNNQTQHYDLTEPEDTRLTFGRQTDTASYEG